MKRLRHMTSPPICCPLLMAFFLVLSRGVAMAQDNTHVLLNSGKTIEILSLSPLAPSPGSNADSAVMLSYRTNILINSRSELRKDADDVWDRFQVDLSHTPYSTAFLCVQSNADATLATCNSMRTFKYVKYGDVWRTKEALSNGSYLDSALVETFMSRIDWLYDHNEMNSYLLYLADDWRGDFADESGLHTVNRMRFASLSSAFLFNVTHFHHQSRLTSISISKDRRLATIERDETEEGEIRGQPFRLVEHEIDVIEINDDVITMVKSSSTTKHK